MEKKSCGFNIIVIILQKNKITEKVFDKKIYNQKIVYLCMYIIINMFPEYRQAPFCDKYRLHFLKT